MDLLISLNFYCQNNQTSTLVWTLCAALSANVPVRLGSEEGGGRNQRNWRIRMKRCESPLRNRKYGTYVKFSGSVRRKREDSSLSRLSKWLI